MELATDGEEWGALQAALELQFAPRRLSIFHGATLATNAPVPVLVVGKCANGWQSPDDGPFKHLPGALYTEDFLRNRLRSYHAERCAHEVNGDTKPYGSAFWRFATALGRLPATGGECPLQRIAWTNIAKIVPEPRGNAGAALFEAQRELAVKTLRFEVERCRPSLVVFTTMGYHDDVLLEVFGLTGWGTLTEGELCRWAPRRGDRPPVLLTRHPQGKKKATVADWLAKARELAGAN